VKTRNVSLGLLSLALMAVAATVAFVGGDVSHLMQLDWHTATIAGLALANAPVALTVSSVQEQIKQFEVKRTQALEGASGLVAKAVEEGRTLDEHETEQHKGFTAEVTSIDKHLQLLKGHERVLVTQAQTVPRDAGREEGSTAEIGSKGAGTGVVTVRSNIPPGLRFTRVAIAMANAKGNVMHAHELAKTYYRDTPEVENVLKAAVFLGGTANLSQANDPMLSKAAVTAVSGTDTAIVQYTDIENEFIDLLRPRLIMGRMTRLNRVPFLSRLGRALTGVTGSFVGEGAPKPVQKQTYDNVTLGYAKVAVIVVLTDEARRFSAIRAEMRARDDMIKGITTYIDKRFMDPSYSGVANVSPASITNGATRYQSTGSTLAAIDADVKLMFAMFGTSDVDPSTAVWVMPATVALRLSMKRNAYDEMAFPGLENAIATGAGTWYGLPVLVSNAMVTSGSPAELQIALVTQDEVSLAEEAGIGIDMSTEASVQMNDAPSAGAQSLVSLWQNNLLGIRAEQYINWGARRANNLGIALLENTNY
jgi:HK97 family phage major capsid protein